MGYQWGSLGFNGVLWGPVGFCGVKRRTLWILTNNLIKGIPPSYKMYDIKIKSLQKGLFWCMDLNVSYICFN